MKFTSLSIVTLSLLSMWHLSNAEDEKKSYTIQMKDNMSHRRMAASPSHEYKIRHVFKHARLIEMHLTKEEAKAMKKRPDVLLVERDSEVEISPVYPYEGPELFTYDLSTGQEVPYGIAMVQANDPIFNEGPTDGYVKVCVVDTGYDTLHEDLPDKNVNGFNPYEDGRWDVDGDSHGTHCAGTIAAIGNAKGVIGVISDENIPLFIGKGLRDGGSGTTARVKEAVEACNINGAKVISMSLGGPVYSAADDAFYNSLVDNDVLVIAASGNGGNDALKYPASYEAVLSVGAVDESQNKASFSTYNDQVELAGPGVGIKSTVPGNNYASYSGTSMACPHVAGVAALVWSYFPNKTADEIREALICSALDKGDAGRDKNYGWGIVQAKAAYQFLENNSTCAPTLAPTPAPTLICDDGEAKVTVNIKTDQYPGETSWTLKASNGEEVMSVDRDGYENANTEYRKSACLSCDGDMHEFTIHDYFEDGICCGYGLGSYEVLVNDIVEASGGEFASSETTTFSICANPSSSPTPAPTMQAQ